MDYLVDVFAILDSGESVGSRVAFELVDWRSSDSRRLKATDLCCN